MSHSLSTSIESTLDEDQVQYLCRGQFCTIHSVDLGGSLHEIPGDLEITDSDAPYVNSSVCIVLGSGGDHRIFISDCNIQRLPVDGLYMIQESRWNRLYRIEFKNEGQELVEEFENICTVHAQSFDRIKSRVKKEQMSTDMISSTSSPQTVRKRLGDTFSALRKRVRPVSDVFVNLKKRSNAKLTKSTENLARGFQFNFLRSATRVQSRESLDESVDSCSKEDIREQIAKIEKEELALREMHDLYRQNLREPVPSSIVLQRAENSNRLVRLRSRYNELSLSELSDLNGSVSHYDSISVCNQTFPLSNNDSTMNPCRRCCPSSGGGNRSFASTLNRHSDSNVPRKPVRTRSMQRGTLPGMACTTSMPAIDQSQRLQDLQNELIQVVSNFGEHRNTSQLTICE